MNRTDIENIEINLLLEAIFQRYGYDFRRYARASIERRVRQLLPKCGCATISELIPKLLYDESFFAPLVHEFSITVSEMFRDPTVYRRLRETVVPLLKTYPFVKIWHAGCASGEEVYSLAILLQEEGLYDRATIFATDFNDAALDQAREGIYALETVQQFTANYQQAGGIRSFSEYYHAHYEAIALDEALKRNITFANHNLVTDGVFGEMHLILCRNVLIYFNKELQNRVLQLFRDSLVRGGFLCLGSKESLLFSAIQTDLKPIDEQARIYQKTTA
ncbi:MAG: protein-glutamate O-methyltransferase CheR [Chloroflexi bacterium]|nr:protein-glutamate O-methyltransferase CheR [Chloroflexota bacterium]MBU1747429.1 protein-glutamate O-methyltransferase CheR [Chloroflexota bacterium]